MSRSLSTVRGVHYEQNIEFVCKDIAWVLERACGVRWAFYGMDVLCDDPYGFQ